MIRNSDSSGFSRFVCVSFVACICLIAGFAADRTFGEQPPVPENAKIVLTSDQPEYFLGENVLVHFALTNTGDEPFEADFGGDYRGAARALRFKVTVSDEQFRELADPYPSDNCFGGMGGTREITRAKPFYNSLPIVRYARFEKAGTYKITIYHDFGWKTPPMNAYPAGEITLEFKEPTEREAKVLVEKWLANEKYGGSTVGEKASPHADFSQIRFGVYLPPLIEHAKKGNKDALIGIGSIRTPEATRVLIEIVTDISLDSKTGDVGEFAKEAYSQLAMRLPDPYLIGELGKRNPFEDDMLEPRRWLVEHAWKDEFADDVRAIAANFLKQTETHLVATGAFMLECVGTKEDAAKLIAALDREVAKTRTMKVEKGLYPRPRGACMELLRASTTLLKRGVPAPENPQSPGECILFATELKQNGDFRPADWLETCDRLLQNEIPFVQEQMLKSLPVPMPASLRPRLRAILKSRDIDASIAACNIVGREKLDEYRSEILEVLKSADEDWLFRAADNAALALEITYPRLEILVSRLDEREMVFKCLESLKTIFSNTGGGGWNSNIDVQSEARRIKPLWEKFIADHRADLEAGKKYELPDPIFSVEMFPEQFTISLSSGDSWPERK